MPHPEEEDLQDLDSLAPECSNECQEESRKLRKAKTRRKVASSEKMIRPSSDSVLDFNQSSQFAQNGIHLPVYCFDVIIAMLGKHPPPKCPSSIPNENLPLFVTWKKGHQRQLRGCIGTFSRNLPLHEGLHEYAQISAFRDSRFDPVTVHEVPHLHCSVSLLVCFEPADHYRDWIIGVHGIRIEYRQHHRNLNAVYLPEVAHEQGWDHEETLNHLMWKGGFKGEITEADRQAVLIERFQSEKMCISYEEYMLFKKQLQKGGDSVSGSHNSSSGSRNGLRNGFLHSCLP